MRIVLFLDLDDTILQTRPKCQDTEALLPAAYRHDGTPLSFMTRGQRALLEMWQRTTTVIPTTARNLDAFRRVDLRFEHHAILDFGGVVLNPDGSLDCVWDARVRPRTAEVSSDLRAMHRAIEQFSERRDLGVRTRVITDFDMPLYVVVKHPEGEAARLRIIREDLLRGLATDRFFIHANDNNLSIVPRFLGKEYAVRYLIERYRSEAPLVTIGMGDSLTDAGFMRECDFSMAPSVSQLIRSLTAMIEGA